MSRATERRRHEALARETASWTSWSVRQWFANDNMALLMLDEPFSGPEMRLDFTCLCSDADRRSHQDNLDRHCVYVDGYEHDPEISRRLSALMRASLQVQGSAFVAIDRSETIEDEAGTVIYRARVDGATDPRAWFAVQVRYVEAIERHVRPERWALLQRPCTPDRPIPPIIIALRGKQGVALVMPTTCPGSGMELAPSEVQA